MLLAAVVSFMLLVLLPACKTQTGAAIAEEDPCSLLEGSAKDNCYFEANKCSKISSFTVRDSCVAELAKLKADIKVCNLIKNEKTKSYCQEQIAELTNDSEICLGIKDPYWQDNCHFNLAIDDNKDAYCSLISSTEQKNKCFYEIALSTKNSVLCELLPRDDKGRCIFQVAVAKPDYLLCQDLEEPINRDSCRKKVARVSNNPEVCELIGTEQIKNFCREQFKK